MAKCFPLTLLFVLSYRACCALSVYGARVNKQNGSVELLTTDSNEGTEVQCISDFLLLAKDSASGSNFSGGFTLDSQCKGDCHLKSKHVPVWIPNSLGQTESGLAMLNADIFLKSFTKETYFVNTLHDLHVYDKDPEAQVRTYLRVWIEPRGVNVSQEEDEHWQVMKVHNVSWVVKIHPEEASRKLEGWAHRYAMETMPHLIKGNISHPYSQLHRAALGQALAFFIHNQGGRLECDSMQSAQKRRADSLRARLDEAAKPIFIEGVQRAVHVIEAQGIRMILTPTGKAYQKVEDGVVEMHLVEMLSKYGADDRAVTKTIQVTFTGGISFPSTPPILLSSPPAPPPAGLCPGCGGTGQTLGNCLWTGQPVTEDCPSCGGSGLAKWRRLWPFQKHSFWSSAKKVKKSASNANGFANDHFGDVLTKGYTARIYCQECSRLSSGTS